MNYLIVGLGNPGDKYSGTRHNVGRIILEKFANANADDFSNWEENGKLKALYSKGKIGKTKVELLMPETFMNNSGVSVKKLVTSKKKAETLVVIYDDLDLGFGDFKISFNRGFGGHKGLESVIKNIKTKEFIRIRVGISPITPKGKIRKPKGEKKVLDWVMKDFKKPEMEILKKLSKKTNEAIETIIKEGRVIAMNRFN
ncbi:aminoacyl-tRNA hydrolase [Patescibacteria group bacterium]|nr:aminoacyl-tRNA hydrolase [Patescibacteria group bacterium]